MNGTSLSAGMALAFGALHALEPGHGKTALLAYVASGEKNWKDAVILSVSSSITHSLVVFLVALSVHFLSYHTTIGVSVNNVGSMLSLSSGIIISLLGMWLILRNFHGKKASCTCSAHTKPSSEGAGKQTFLASGMLGMAMGIVPCPTIVVAYVTGVATGSLTIGLQNVMLFSLGMCLSLISLVIFLEVGSDKLRERISRGKQSKLNWNLVQGILFIAIGIATALFH